MTIRDIKDIDFIDDELDHHKRRRINFDFILYLSVLILSGIGLLVIYSATRYSLPLGVQDPMFYLERQGFWMIAAVSVSLLLQFINYRWIKKFWWVLYAASLILLALVLFIGYEVNNARSWIDLGFSSIQPSEFSKIVMVISVAAVLGKWKREKHYNIGFKKVLLSLLIAFSCIFLVLLEPDYGTAVIYFATYIGILFISGANILYFFGITGLTVGGFFLALRSGLIKQYQLDRILVFLKPDIQKEGAGYNLYHSKLAIGSGGLFGKGLFLGEQTNLSYVPAHHTDFIYAVIGEEMGFFGAVFVILIFGLIIWRCFYVASKAGNPFGSMLASGIGFIILTQAVINIGMTIGIMPIIGIPLPFLSYGGSNLLSIFIGIGLVENVWIRRELRKEHEIANERFK